MEWFVWYFVVGVTLAILGGWFDQSYPHGEPSTEKELITLIALIIMAWPLIFGTIFVLCVIHVLSAKFRRDETKS